MAKRGLDNQPLPPLNELLAEFGIIGGEIVRRSTGKPVGSDRIAGHTKYRDVGFQGSVYKAHRLLFYMHFGIDPVNKLIDHGDGNGLNNWPWNMRSVSDKSNSKNRRRQSNNATGITGVHYDTRAKRYRAMLTVGVASLSNSTRGTLGTSANKRLSKFFDTLPEAAAWIETQRSIYGYSERHGNEGKYITIPPKNFNPLFFPPY